MSLLLGVNIDHVATLRQARYAQNLDAPICEPSVIEAARAAQRGGADSITVHVREDRRHMQEEDALAIRKKISLPLNLEMANTQEMLALALNLKPDFVCLVPENRAEVTTEGGLNVSGEREALQPTIHALQEAGIRVSLFIDPDQEQISQAITLGAEMIELHTGSFALAKEKSDQLSELNRLIRSSDYGNAEGLRVNAGHGIHLQNIKALFDVKYLSELNVGHTLIASALSVGLESAVANFKAAMTSYKGGAS